jgi:hypothetical protein
MSEFVVKLLSIISNYTSFEASFQLSKPKNKQTFEKQRLRRKL